MADETAAKEAVHTALTAAQMEFAELEQTAVSVCQELEGEAGLPSTPRALSVSAFCGLSP